MGYAIYYDQSKERFSGYEVPAPCEQPECKTEIDRGIERICGGSPGGGGIGCGLAFCGEHQHYPEKEVQHLHGSLCARCVEYYDGGEMIVPVEFPKKPELKEWTDHQANDPSWAEWRAERASDV